MLQVLNISSWVKYYVHLQVQLASNTLLSLACVWSLTETWMQEISQNPTRQFTTMTSKCKITKQSTVLH